MLQFHYFEMKVFFQRSTLILIIINSIIYFNTIKSSTLILIIIFNDMNKLCKNYRWNYLKKKKREIFRHEICITKYSFECWKTSRMNTRRNLIDIDSGSFSITLHLVHDKEYYLANAYLAEKTWVFDIEQSHDSRRCKICLWSSPTDFLGREKAI